MTNTEFIPLISALVAAVITLIGIIINFYISRKQITNSTLQLKLKEQEIQAAQERFREEIRLKNLEIENTQQKLKSELEALRQNQLQTIMEKRLEAYPKLWAIHINYETNWTFDKKKKNKTWAKEYVQALNDFNVNYGLFITEDLYKKFFELRSELYKAIESVEEDHQEISGELTTQIRRIVYGHNGPGLSTIEKDDLGSYINVAVARRKNV
jgi:hypothetical protein